MAVKKSLKNIRMLILFIQKKKLNMRANR